MDATMNESGGDDLAATSPASRKRPIVSLEGGEGGAGRTAAAAPSQQEEEGALVIEIARLCAEPDASRLEGETLRGRNKMLKRRCVALNSERIVLTGVCHELEAKTRG